MRQDSRPERVPSAPGQRALKITPVRLRDPGGGSRSAALALVALVAVVAIAVAIPMLLAARPGPSAPAVALASAARSARSPGPSPAGASEAVEPSPEPLPAASLRLPDEVYNAHELGQVVAAGELDGRLVIVRGSLETIVFPCDREPDPLHTCVMVAIEGVDLPVTAGAITLPWHDDPPPGDYLVVVPYGGRLVYIGHLPPTGSSPSTIDGLTRALLRRDGAGAPVELFVVDGWLIPDPPSGCPASPEPGTGTCYEPGPFLADEPPVQAGQPANRRGSNVLIGDAVGFDPAADVIEGPFLVAMLTAEQCATSMFEAACGGTGPRWVVEAVYDDTAAWAHVP